MLNELKPRIAELETHIEYRDCQIKALKQVNDELEAHNKSQAEVLEKQTAMTKIANETVTKLMKENEEVNIEWNSAVQKVFSYRQLARERDGKIKELIKALNPFAQFACEPLGSCNGIVNCHNCRAKRILEVKE